MYETSVVPPHNGTLRIWYLGLKGNNFSGTFTNDYQLQQQGNIMMVTDVLVESVIHGTRSLGFSNPLF